MKPKNYCKIDFYTQIIKKKRILTLIQLFKDFVNLLFFLYQVKFVKCERNTKLPSR